MNLLRKFLKRFYRKPVPLMFSTPELIKLFDKLKKLVTYSLFLARFYPDKPTFLKTDWNAEGVGWILIQTVYDE